MLLIGLVFGSALVAAIALVKWYESVQVRRKYYDGTYRTVCALDLPMEAWEKKFRGEMSEAEWFGWQRGYQRGLADALAFFECAVHLHIHGNRLEPRPAPNHETAS